LCDPEALVEVRSSESLLLFSHCYVSSKAVASMILSEDSQVVHGVVPPAAADLLADSGLTNFGSLVCTFSLINQWRSLRGLCGWVLRWG